MIFRSLKSCRSIIPDLSNNFSVLYTVAILIFLSTKVTRLCSSSTSGWSFEPNVKVWTQDITFAIERLLGKSHTFLFCTFLQLHSFNTFIDKLDLSNYFLIVYFLSKFQYFQGLIHVNQYF